MIMMMMMMMIIIIITLEIIMSVVEREKISYYKRLN
jgi:hypothetical protein